MKKIIIIISFLLNVHCLTAQEEIIESGKTEWLLRLNFGYNSEFQDNLDYISQNLLTQKSSNFITDFSVAKRLGNHFYYGVGLAYNFYKSEIKPEYGSSSPMTDRTKESTVSPYVFVQYFNPLSNKLFFGLDLYSRLAHVKVSSEYNYVGTFSSSRETVYDSKYIAFGFVPSLRYLIGSKLGIDLKLGVIDFNKKIDDSRADIDKTSEEFNIGFKPEYWRLGAFVTL